MRGRAIGLGSLVATAVLVLPGGQAEAALVIERQPTHNMTCVGGVCTATAADAVLGIKDVKALLKEGDLKVVSGAAAADIVIHTTFSWTKPHRLTLDAWRSIVFQARVVSKGEGGATLATNDGGSGGDLTFGEDGSLAFWDHASSLIVNGDAYTLVGHLSDLRAAVSANPSGNYALAGGVKSKTTYDRAPVNDPFHGKFEGLGHNIRDLNIVGTKEHLGLFSKVEAGAVVRDLSMTNVTIRTVSHRANVGALAGDNAGTIRNVSVQGQIYGDFPGRQQVVGALVGWNTGDVLNSSANLDTVGAYSSTVGGLVGVSSGLIERSHATGQATVHSATQFRGDSYVGGLVGRSSGTILLSYSTVTVKGYHGYPGDIESYVWAGGLAGSASAVSQSWSSGSVTTGYLSFAGGLVGDGTGAGAGVVDSYSRSPVTMEDSAYAGGLLSESSIPVQTSYAVGNMTGEESKCCGGLLAWDVTPGHVANCYWDLDTTGVSDPHRGALNPPDDPGITGLTDAQLKAGLPAGFDPQVWGHDAAFNGGYPYLLANPPR